MAIDIETTFLRHCFTIKVTAKEIEIV